MPVPFLYAATTAIVFGFYTLAIATAAKIFAGSRLSGSPLFNFGFFLVAIPLMYIIGLALHGRIFPFDFSDPLVTLGALANLGMGLTYVIASTLNYGAGDVRAVTYEYGITFLIVAGLLNVLVVIDVYDVALGRK